MRIDILTLFPEMFAPLDASMIGRARQSGAVEIRVTNIRDYTTDKHQTTDDRLYGGGAGMVLKPEPLFAAVEDAARSAAAGRQPRVVVTAPGGRPYDQRLAEELAQEEQLILICGHYEGIDQRVIDALATDVVSLGDFVLLATQTNPLYAGLARDPEALGLENPGSLFGNVLLLFQLLFTRPLETLHWMIFEKFDIIFMRRVDYVAYFVTITTLVKDVTLYLGLLGAVRGLFSKQMRWFTAAFALYFLAIFLFVPTARYGLQYYPLLAVFAGYAVVLLFRGTPDAGIFSRRKNLSVLSGGKTGD